MNKIFLLLFSYPVFFTPLISLMMIAQPAQARELVFISPHLQQQSCQGITSVSNLVCQRVQQRGNSAAQVDSKATGDGQVMQLNFTEEESDAAIALFGCDCIVCVNALRQMRGLPPA